MMSFNNFRIGFVGLAAAAWVDEAVVAAIPVPLADVTLLPWDRARPQPHRALRPVTRRVTTIGEVADSCGLGRRAPATTPFRYVDEPT
jgi:hypothetical protein